MDEPILQKEENIVIRTMKGDLEQLSGILPEKEKKVEPAPFAPIRQLSQETQVPIAQAPTAHTLPPKLKTETKPPILIIPPKTIPPKEITEIPAKPLFKATPIWFKIGGIGLGVAVLSLIGLYGYWKIFIQSRPIVQPFLVPITKPPTLPGVSTATTTVPIKFFNKLPNKEVTIELSSKTSAALLNALKSEATIEETRASVKQIKITYQGKPITTEEFFNLMQIFTPQNFLLNYESEFALAFFYHLYPQEKEVRPIIIIKAKNQELAQNQMQTWEKSLISDINPLFLTEIKMPEKLIMFKSYSFVKQPVRYINVGIPHASFNYSIYNDLLILSTTSAGLFVILQDLTEQSVSLNYLELLEASIGNFR